MAFRVCHAYRTVSAEAAAVLASFMPIHILAQERKEVFESELPPDLAKAKAHERAMNTWQGEWESGKKGGWTRILITNIKIWIERKHGTMDFYLTRALSGHRVCKAYTKKKERLKVMLVTTTMK